MQVKSKAQVFWCYMCTDQLTPVDKSAFRGTAVSVRVCLLGACDFEALFISFQAGNLVKLWYWNLAKQCKALLLFLISPPPPYFCTNMNLSLRVIYVFLQLQVQLTWKNLCLHFPEHLMCKPQLWVIVMLWLFS